MTTNEGGLCVMRGPDWKWVNQDGREGCSGTVVVPIKKSELLPLSPSSKQNIPCAERELSTEGPDIPDDSLDSHPKAGLNGNDECDSGTKEEHRAGFLFAHDLQVLQDTVNGGEHSLALPIQKADDAFPEVRNQPSSLVVESNETVEKNNQSETFIHYEHSGNKENEELFCILCDRPGFRYALCRNHKGGFIVVCSDCHSSKIKCSNCWKMERIYILKS